MAAGSEMVPPNRQEIISMIHDNATPVHDMKFKRVELSCSRSQKNNLSSLLIRLMLANCALPKDAMAAVVFLERSKLNFTHS